MDDTTSSTRPGPGKRLIDAMMAVALALMALAVITTIVLAWLHWTTDADTPGWFAPSLIATIVVLAAATVAWNRSERGR